MKKHTIVNEHLYPVIDLMIENAVNEVSKQGETIKCKKGCAHCCYLLIEITWEEAVELAHFVKQQPPKKKKILIERIRKNAADAREFFSKTKRGRRFMNPVEGDHKIPDKLFDDYFYKAPRPCPMLVNNACSAYHYRPSPCRLHLVTSPSKNCARDAPIDSETVVPEEVEEVKDDLGPVIANLHHDNRWGHFGIMLEAALTSLNVK